MATKLKKRRPSKASLERAEKIALEIRKAAWRDSAQKYARGNVNIKYGNYILEPTKEFEEDIAK